MENQIVVNFPFKTKPIHPTIFGSFIEHIGECVQKGIWSDDSVTVPMVENDPFLSRIRMDLLLAIKELRLSVLRWPGGCYSDVYHWENAVGLLNHRQKVKNEFWNSWGKGLFDGLSDEIRKQYSDAEADTFRHRLGQDIDNEFGTNEFLRLCEKIEATPYLNVNYGSGTAEEAANWVEYCNGSTSTSFGALRKKHGRDTPYNVPLWGIANEIYLENETGFERDPKNYASRYSIYAEKMREKDPTIQLVGCGWNVGSWNRRFLEGIKEKDINYLSIHHYLPFPTDLRLLMKKKHPTNETVFHAMMGSPVLVRQKIMSAWNDIASVFGDDTHVRVALDEWGIWYTVNDLVKSNYNLMDGIHAALMLMMFQKLSDIVPLNLWSMLVNSMGMIGTDNQGLVLTPVYHALSLFTNHTYNNSIETVTTRVTEFDSPEYGQASRVYNVPYIDVHATCSDDEKRVSLMFINKHFSDYLTIRLKINGFPFVPTGEIVELSGNSPFDMNTQNSRERITLRERVLENIKPETTLKLKPHSVTILKLKEPILHVSI